MTHLPETWDTIEVNDSDIGKKINEVLELHSNPNDSPPAPLILLVHDYPMVKASLENLGIQTSKWKYELEELLGFPLHDGLYSQRMARDSKHSRDRSRSPPRAGSSKVHHSRETRSPVPMQSYAPVYVVDTMAMYKAMTGVGGHSSTIRPVSIFNEITFNKELDYVCGGSDSK